jgi:transcriptional regulator with XRE-family HTH domain
MRIRPRSRPTEAARETDRRTTTIGIALGRDLARARHDRHLTQHALAERAGVSQSTYSRIERGRVGAVPLATLVALGVALERPLAISLTRPLGATAAEPRDAGHLEIQEHLLALARATGRLGMFEVPTRPLDPRRSTDVGLRDTRLHLRILAECWNSFGDLGAAVRATTHKTAEATATWPDDRVATVWVVRASAANRALLARYANVVEAAFPGSSRRWARALTTGVEPPPTPGLVWFDPATSRLLEHRRARRAAPSSARLRSTICR